MAMSDFLMEMLRTRGTDLKGKTVLISGAGNVAQYTAEKVLELGGKVLTMSEQRLDLCTIPTASIARSSTTSWS